MIYEMFLNKFEVDNLDESKFGRDSRIITLDFIGNNSVITVRTPTKMLDIFNVKEHKFGKQQYRITIEEIKENKND